jgi:transketolase
VKNAFINTITELAQKDEKIVLLTADLGYKIFDNFNEMFPNRFYNVGIAEANMVSMAAGLTLEGFKPYIYSIVPFVTARCYEQIRNDIAYNFRNVKIIGAGGGCSYGHGGMSHHGIEDISIMRSMPNMFVFCPGDSFETEAVISCSYGVHTPCYIRLGRGGEPKIHKEKIKNYTSGQVIFFSHMSFKKVHILSTGGILSTAFKLRDNLKSLDIDCEVVSFPSIVPLSVGSICDIAKKSELIVTLEENYLKGGFGSAVAECLMEQEINVKFMRFGIEGFQYYSGDQDYLRKKNGLSVFNMSKNILKKLEML